MTSKTPFSRGSRDLRPALLTLALSFLLPAPAWAQATPPAVPEESPPAAVEERTEESPLVPAWEEEVLKDRQVPPVKIRFRPGKGLELTSEDGDFSIVTKLRAQLLYVLESELEDGETALAEALQIRRARLAFTGNLFGKHNKYKMELAFAPRDVATSSSGVGTSPLLDWYLTFDYLPQATVVAGQYKVPFSRQRVISSGSLQFVDRSLIQSEFNLDRDIGLDVRASKPLFNHFRYYAGVSIGEGRNVFEETEPGLMYLGRVEVLPFGNFADYVEADFERDLRPRLSMGLAYAYIQNARRNAGLLGRVPADEGTTNFHNATADVMFKFAGFSLLSEGFYRQGLRNPGTARDPNGLLIPPEPPRDGVGFFAQAGYLLPRTALEVGARYGQMRPTTSESRLPRLRELGAMVSYYFAHHSLKLQADYFRIWSGQDDFAQGNNQFRVQLEAGF